DRDQKLRQVGFADRIGDSWLRVHHRGLSKSPPAWSDRQNQNQSRNGQVTRPAYKNDHGEIKRSPSADDSRAIHIRRQRCLTSIKTYAEDRNRLRGVAVGAWTRVAVECNPQADSFARQTRSDLSCGRRAESRYVSAGRTRRDCKTRDRRKR